MTNRSTLFVLLACLACLSLAVAFRIYPTPPPMEATPQQEPEDVRYGALDAAGKGIQWWHCKGVDKIATLDIRSVLISPNPPVRQENVTFGLSGRLLEPITRAHEINVLVYFGPIKVFNQSIGTCEFGEKKGALACPIPATDNFDMRFTDEFPTLVNGHYKWTLRSDINQTHHSFCLQGNLIL